LHGIREQTWYSWGKFGLEDLDENSTLLSYMVASHLQGNCAWRGGWLRTYIRTRSREVPAGPDGFRRKGPNLNERTQGPRNVSGLPLRGPTCLAIVQYTCATVDEVKCLEAWLLYRRCLIRSPIRQQRPDRSRHLVGQCHSDDVRRTSRQQKAQSLGQVLRT